MIKNLNVFGALFVLVGSPLNADCYKATQKLEAVYAKKEDPDAGLLDKELKNYLCAAKDNNAAAAVRAVQLSRSGMTHQLPVEKEKDLLEQANKLGNGVAAYILAEDARPNAMSNCENIICSMDMLKMSVLRGDKDAPLLLGVIYKRGYGLPASPMRALACYKLALKGDAEAAQRKIAGLRLPDEIVSIDWNCPD